MLIVFGEWIRLAGVAAAGTVTRRRSRDVQRLVTYGIFRWVRNPLYVGNFLIWMGFVVISGVLWFLPIAIVIFAIEYTLIVAYEEGVLESIFGQEYLDYKQTTPRWIPRPPRAAARAGRTTGARRGAARSARSCSTRRWSSSSSSSKKSGGSNERELACPLDLEPPRQVSVEHRAQLNLADRRRQLAGPVKGTEQHVAPCTRQNERGQAYSGIAGTSQGGDAAR